MRQGWELKKLGEIATLQRGFDLPTHERVSGKYPLVSSSGIIDTHNKKGADSPGVATGRSGSIGNVFYIEEDFWPLNTVLYVKDFHGNVPRFIFHLLNHFDLKRFATGTGVPTLNRNFVHDELVLIPSSIPEQHRIVAILDDAFAGIATAKANAEKNLQNARELFESHLQAVFSERGEGWVEITLGESCEIKPPKSEAKNKLKSNDMVTFMPMECLGINQKYAGSETIKRLDEVSGSYTYFAENDVLLAKITPCFENGKLGIAKNLTNGIGFGSSEYIVFRPSEKLMSEWLYYFLLRQSFRNEGAAVMTGAVGHKRVPKEFIEEYLIPIPPINEQKRLVKILDNIQEEIERLTLIYQRKIQTLDELKKALLHKAFSGEL